MPEDKRTKNNRPGITRLEYTTYLTTQEKAFIDFFFTGNMKTAQKLIELKAAFKFILDLDTEPTLIELISLAHLGILSDKWSPRLANEKADIATEAGKAIYLVYANPISHKSMVKNISEIVTALEEKFSTDISMLYKTFALCGIDISEVHTTIERLREEIEA